MAVEPVCRGKGCFYRRCGFAVGEVLRVEPTPAVMRYVWAVPHNSLVSESGARLGNAESTTRYRGERRPSSQLIMVRSSAAVTVASKSSSPAAK